MIKINRSLRARTPLALAIACGALALLWPDWLDELRAQGYLSPQNLTVDCDDALAEYTSINAALAVLDPSASGHTITVTGTCDEDAEGTRGVEIRNFDGLTLQAP
ncbi:MAG: hypothetical protein ACE1Y4_09605, partial [Lysobacterales bacterium]